MAQVAEVFDGDTVRLTDERHVRLVGINAPELGHSCRPEVQTRPATRTVGTDCRPTVDEPLAAEARDRLRALADGKTVRLEFEDEQRDRYGRWLGHLALADGTSPEEILLKEGLACAIAIPPNLARLARYQADEAEARQARRGIWGHPYYVPVAAEALAPRRTGFHFVRGRVRHVGASRKFVYLDLAPRFALRITHADWQRYFRGRPEDWRGANVEARGWVTEQNGRLHLGIGHPAMIRRLP